jgi:hypothetical protein
MYLNMYFAVVLMIAELRFVKKNPNPNQQNSPTCPFIKEWLRKVIGLPYNEIHHY